MCRLFSSYGEWGYPLVAVCRFLTVRLLLLQSTGARMRGLRHLQSVGSVAEAPCSRAQAQ